MSEKKSNLRLPTCYYCDLPFDHDFDNVVNENTQRLFIGYQPCEKCKKQIIANNDHSEKGESND